jgi:Spx/MgsR family transcriptional regulator
MYGISNCDTIKKAKKWLEQHQIEYQFHDYKKSSVDAAFLEDMIKQHGVDTVVNKRGTTFRKLTDEQKEKMTQDSAVPLLIDNPSMIKRPILVHQGGSHIGFKADDYAEIFNLA